MKLLQELATDKRNMQGAIFTTFPFSPEFFENAVLPTLSKKNLGRDTVVLVDSDSYQNLVNQQSQSRTPPSALGQQYQFAPVSLPGKRVFHPKVFFFGSEKRAYAFVGSANLTKSAFMSNQEAVSYFESGSSDPDKTSIPILQGIRQFFRQLLDDRSTHAIGAIPRQRIETVLEATSWVTENIEQDTAPKARVLHNLESPILEQVFAILQSQTNITNARIIAPFFGRSLNVAEAFTDRGIDTELLLQQSKTQIDAEALRDWLQHPEAAARVYTNGRYVHGKIIIIETENSTFCLSGSANASRQAMLETGSYREHGNIEVCSLRRMDDSNFQYLLTDFELTDVEVDSFTPGEFGEFNSSTTASEARDIELLDAGFTENASRSGGRLRFRASIPSGLDSVPTFVVEPTNPDFNPTSIDFPPHTIEEESEQEVKETICGSKEIHTDEPLRTLKQAARVFLRVGDTKSNIRWLSASYPTPEQHADKATEDGGTNFVPRYITSLFLTDEDERTEVATVLHSVLRGLGETDQGQQASADRSPPSDEEGTDEAERGLRIPKWSKKHGSSNPDGIVESFYDGWVNDLTVCIRNFQRYPEKTTEVFAKRLSALNQMSSILLMLEAYADRYGSTSADIPADLPPRFFKDLYSNRTPVEDGNVSKVAQFADEVDRFRNNPDKQVTDGLYRAIRDQLVPNLVLGSLIAQHQLTESLEQYFDWYRWDFERETCRLLIGEEMSTSLISGELSEATTEHLRKQLDIISVQTQEDQQLRACTPRIFTNDSSLHRVVREYYQRCLLVSDEKYVQSIMSDDQLSETRFESLRQYQGMLPPDSSDIIRDLL